MLSRSIVVQSLRSIRDRFFDTRQKNDVQGTSDDVTGPSLDNLSVRHDSLNFISIYLPDALLKVHTTAIYVRNVILAYYVLITDSIHCMHVNVHYYHITSSLCLFNSTNGVLIQVRSIHNILNKIIIIIW